MKLNLTTECYLMDMKFNIKEVNMPYMAHFLQNMKSTHYPDYSLWQYLSWLDDRIKEYKKLLRHGVSALLSFEDFLNIKDPVKKKNKKTT